MCLVALFMEQRAGCSAQGTLICLWQPGMGYFSSRLTWLWGARAFLLGCCGVPGAELKPMGCSLQPAPTARKRQTADMVDINVSLELFIPWDWRSRSVPPEQIREVCAWRSMTCSSWN